jgi:hypothetical protein
METQPQFTESLADLQRAIRAALIEGRAPYISLLPTKEFQDDFLLIWRAICLGAYIGDVIGTWAYKPSPYFNYQATWIDVPGLYRGDGPVGPVEWVQSLDADQLWALIMANQMSWIFNQMDGIEAYPVVNDDLTGTSLYRTRETRMREEWQELLSYPDMAPDLDLSSIMSCMSAHADYTVALLVEGHEEEGSPVSEPDGGKPDHERDRRELAKMLGTNVYDCLPKQAQDNLLVAFEHTQRDQNAANDAMIVWGLSSAFERELNVRIFNKIGFRDEFNRLYPKRRPCLGDFKTALDEKIEISGFVKALGIDLPKLTRVLQCLTERNKRNDAAHGADVKSGTGRQLWHTMITDLRAFNVLQRKSVPPSQTVEQPGRNTSSFPN